MHRGFGTGYGLVITTTKVIGAKKTPWLSVFEHYLGPGSKVNDSDRARAIEIASELTSQKEFELPLESVLKILYKRPGYFSKGRILFKTTNQGDFELTLASMTPNVGVASTIKELLPSLAAFTSDKFFDEKTGQRIYLG